MGCEQTVAVEDLFWKQKIDGMSRQTFGTVLHSQVINSMQEIDIAWSD